MVRPNRPDNSAARRALIRWYKNRSRVLPWRQNKSPYTVWVSEVMLQQTQIDTVIPYYQRFVGEFPTVDCLAKAPLERVLKLWSGLGYYRRARNLHEAAREVVQRYRGRFPDDLKQACSLPGVGDYTARAVLSIAYDRPFAVIDGNVARVMARFLALRGTLQQPGVRRTIERNLNLLLSRRRPGEFNQALMELGQTTCVPRSPKCTSCPLRRWCKAFRFYNPENFPRPQPRRQAEEWHMAAAVLHRNGRILLSRGIGEGVLDDLWNFPAGLARSSSNALGQLKEKLQSATGTSPYLTEPDHQLRHNITFRSIRVQIYIGEVTGRVPKSGFRWFLPQAIETAAVSQLARKIARKVIDGGSKAQGG